jgi:23S rRNA U2552 (ribose-2'-O)-methylase RlmE/FtsJ
MKMDLEIVVEQFRRTAEGQLRIAGDDPSVAAAGQAVMLSLEPALRLAALTLAEQAAAEITAQLPDHTVDVVVADSQPTLVLRDAADAVTINTEDCDARMTVRLPEELKDDLETAASDLGDSVNTFVVKALAGSAEALKRTSRSTFEGTIET